MEATPLRGSRGLDAHQVLGHQQLCYLSCFPHICYLITYPFSGIIDPYNQFTASITEKRVFMKAPTKDQLLADILSDATWAEIAAKYGYSDARFLRKLALRYDLPRRRVILRPSEEDLRRMILTEGLTPYEVADKLGYGPEGWSNIYKYCRDYGIEFDFSKNHDLRAVPFTQRQKDIALGSLLGDAYLRPSGNSFSLSFCHGEKQKEYLDWKRNEFRNFVTQTDYYCNRREFHGNMPSYQFGTINHPYLTELHTLCYGSGRKTVTAEWLDQLSPLSLAVWYMDDGSINKRYGTIVLCTNSFAADEQAMMVDYFISRYGIEPKIEPRRNGQSVLRINASQRYRFFDLVSAHIPNCMSYKLG